MKNTRITPYPNSLLYLLTQVFGVTLLIGWLAHVANVSGINTSISRYFFDTASRSFPSRGDLVLSAFSEASIWLLPVALALISGFLALLSHNVKTLKPLRAVLWSIFAVACLTPVLADGIKHYTTLPHPFELAMFGGYENPPTSIWAPSGHAAGNALPSVHAVAGFILLCLYFSGWALDKPRLRWGGLLVGIVMGFALGFMRIAQGAHFLSQILWSCAMAWLLCSIVFYPLIARRPASTIPEGEHTLDEIWTHVTAVQVRRRATMRRYGILLAFLLPVTMSSWSPDSFMHDGVEWLGLLLILTAIAGRCWCILYLGGHKGSQLIDLGPYSISRNPLYMFSIIAVAGIGAQSGSLLVGLAMALFVYAVFSSVISEEERLLRKVFGRDFDAYCKRVPRFGPRFSQWRNEESLTISVSGLWNTLRDALPYLLAIPFFELIEWAQGMGWLPVLLRLP